MMLLKLKAESVKVVDGKAQIARTVQKKIDKCNYKVKKCIARIIDIDQQNRISNKKASEKKKMCSAEEDERREGGGVLEAI